jgi:hypothetical protein
MAGRRNRDNVGGGQLAFDLFCDLPADEPAAKPTGEGGTDEQVRTPRSALTPDHPAYHELDDKPGLRKVSTPPDNRRYGNPTS